MSFKPQVITAFLNSYVTARKPTWHSFQGWVTSWARNDEGIKTAECVTLNRRFYNPQVTDLTNLDHIVILLNELGKDAQSQSIINGTYQAVRTYIIAKILEEIPDDKTHEAFRQQYTRYVNDLREETQCLYNKSITMRQASSSRNDVAKNDALYEENLKKLSNLGDSWAISVAAKEKLLSPLLLCPNLKTDADMPFGKTFNENIPFYYHQNYYRIHFEIYYRPTCMTEFENYEKRAIEENNCEINIDPQLKARTLTKPTLLGGIASMWSQGKTAAPPTEGPSHRPV